MQFFISFLFVWFGGLFGFVSYHDAEPVMACFGLVMALIGCAGFFMKE